MSEKEHTGFEFLYGGFKQKRGTMKPTILTDIRSQRKSSSQSYLDLDYIRKKHPITPGKLCKEVFPEDYEQESQNNDLDLGK